MLAAALALGCGAAASVGAVVPEESDAGGSAAALLPLQGKTKVDHPPRSLVSFTHGQMYSPPRAWKTVEGVTTRSGGGRMDLEALLRTLVETNTNSVGLDLEVATDWLDLVLFLNTTQNVVIAGRPLRVWVVLHSPSHSCKPGTCFGCARRCTQSLPVDSPLTSFNETAGFNRTLCPILYNASATAQPDAPLHFGCFDYPAWGRVIGLLGQQFPHLVAVHLDDFSDESNLEGGHYGVYTPESLRRTREGLQVGHVALIGGLYYTRAALNHSLY
eukprot:SAG11_NODE_6824_length_1239_cov_1.713158_1_plen_272_part_01